MSRRDRSGLLPDVVSALDPPSYLEKLTGYCGGLLPADAIEWPGGPPRDPVEVLRGILRQALTASPCVVAFSGGRDSSALAALAFDEARRHGLPLPIPVTMRFPDVPAADETAWQEQVARHIGFQDWEILTIHDELDLIGPLAQEACAALGRSMFPANAHVILPLAEVAEGGTLIHGFDGDGVFGGWSWRPVADLFTRRVPPDSVAIKSSLAAVMRRYPALTPEKWGMIQQIPWVAPEVRRAVRRSGGEAARGASMSQSGHARWMAQNRFHWLTSEEMRRLSAHRHANVSTPFSAPSFLASFGQRRENRIARSRTNFMHDLFGGLLPGLVLSRSSKAILRDVFVGPASLTWLEGEGREVLVDGQWRGIAHLPVNSMTEDLLNRHGQSATLLQMAALAGPPSVLPSNGVVT